MSTAMDVKAPQTFNPMRLPMKNEIKMYKTINKNFDEQEFIEGVKVAHEVVDDLLFQKNLQPLSDMLTEECFQHVISYFQELSEKNQTISGELKSIKSASIASIYVREYDGNLETYVLVRYDVEDQGCLKDSSGDIIQGSEESKTRTHHWLFKNENDSWKIASFFGRANPTDFQ